MTGLWKVPMNKNVPAGEGRKSSRSKQSQDYALLAGNSEKFREAGKRGDKVRKSDRR